MGEPKLGGGPGLGGQNLWGQPIPTAVLAWFASHLHSTASRQTWVVRKPKDRGICLRAGPRLGPLPEASLAFMSRKTTLCFACGISLFKGPLRPHAHILVRPSSGEKFQRRSRGVESRADLGTRGKAEGPGDLTRDSRLKQTGVLTVTLCVPWLSHLLARPSLPVPGTPFASQKEVLH